MVSINVGNLFHKGSNGQNSTHGETHRPLDFARFKRYVAEGKRRIKTPGENPTLSAILFKIKELREAGNPLSGSFFYFGMNDMKFCKAQVRSVKRQTGRGSALRSANEEFCRARSARPLLGRRTKRTSDFAPIVTHGLQVRSSVLRPRGRGRHCQLRLYGLAK